MMVRVLHIDTERGWRGGENQLRYLIVGLNAQGVSNHVATRPGSEVSKRLAPLASIVEVPTRGGFAPFAALSLASYCDQHRIQILHAHTGNAHSLGLFVKYLRPHLKLVVHRRVDYQPQPGFFSKKKYLSSKIDRYVAISEAVRSILENYGIKREKISLVRSAVAYSDSTPQCSLQAKKTLAATYGVDPSLLFIGNASALTHQKGYENLLSALALLKAQNILFHAFIAGDGNLRESLEKQSKSLGLAGSVTFLGFIEHVKEFLAGLDILAVPSRYEGLGTIILDGIHAGLCVVASNVGGIPEIIQDGMTGLLAPVDDPYGLAQQLIKAAKDPLLRQHLNAQAKEHIAKRFSVDEMVLGNLEIYRSLI